jgi:hypothetical protein
MKINYGIYSIINSLLCVTLVWMSYIEDFSIILSNLLIFTGMFIGILGIMCGIYSVKIKEKGIYKYIGLSITAIILLLVVSVPFINKFIIYN